MRTLPFLFLALGSALLITACGSSEPDIEEVISSKLPEGWELTDFEIRAKEDVGSEVSPRLNYRFSGEVAPVADFYETAGTINSQTVLYKVRDGGVEAPIHGTANAFFRADSWEATLNFEEVPWEEQEQVPWGQPVSEQKPREAWGENTVVIGSSAYREFKRGIVSDMAEAKKAEYEQKKKLDEFMNNSPRPRDQYEAALADAKAELDELRSSHNDAVTQQRAKMKTARSGGAEAYQAEFQRTNELSRQNKLEFRDAQQAYRQKEQTLREQFRKDQQEYQRSYTALQGFVADNSRAYQSLEQSLNALEQQELKSTDCCSTDGLGIPGAAYDALESFCADASTDGCECLIHYVGTNTPEDEYELFPAAIKVLRQSPSEQDGSTDQREALAAELDMGMEEFEEAMLKHAFRLEITMDRSTRFCAMQARRG